jgi:hypothetical protein
MEVEWTQQALNSLEDIFWTFFILLKAPPEYQD